ncbi:MULTISPECIES: protease modulator HflC [Kordiimonas]|jgi:membrane protease subunit HflC|uniref:Protein HflC n=1 Tax=Kordiimonas lacus TaxID=637679 RepID=A0A1G7AUZ0_9PROT|nr:MULTISPECIES: protease modulator HflC [Kordiimonas]SDE18659.1 membrane protease subunit HflC [Kordiimonas lacus]
MNAKTIAGLVVLGALLLVGLSGFYVIDERQQAIVVKFGNPQRTVTAPGLHFKLPFLEQVIFLEKRILSLDVPPQEVLASDQRRILVDSFARYRIADPLKRYQAARTEVGAARLLEDAMESTVRQVLAKEPMNEIVSGQRAELMKKISDLTNQRALTFGLEVVDVRLKRVDLPQENSKAIFMRMETERQREAAEKRASGRRDAVKIRAAADRQVAEIIAQAERKSQTIRGEADGEAVKIFADAYGKDEDFFEFYRTMQAYRKSLGKDDTRLVLSPDSEFFKLFMDRK